MWALEVAAVDEAIELGLLQQEVSACGPRDLFLEYQVHAFVAAVPVRRGSSLNAGTRSLSRVTTTMASAAYTSVMSK